MKKRILMTTAIGLILTAGIATALMTSYESITGYTTIEQSIILDIMGSSNDTYYSLSGYQGETLYSPQIKLNNKADVSINVNISVELIDGNYSDLNISLVDSTKNNTIGNIINVPINDTYIYIRHQFYPNSSVGNYSFIIQASPV